MKISLDNPKFAIVNCSDRPYEGLVAQFFPDVGYCYNSQALPGLGHRKQYNGMTPPHPTALEDFGFDIVETAEGFEFTRVRKSVAKYHDGSPREWQGADQFTLPKLVNPRRAA